MKLLLTMLVVISTALMPTVANAQQVTTTLNVSEYDILFLTELMDVKTQKLSSSVSSFSLNLAVTPTQNSSFRVCVYIDIQVQLRGDPHPQTLLSGYTKGFSLIDNLTLTARDFAKSGSNLAVMDRYDHPEDAALKQRIINLAQTTSTAPPGTYRITMIVLPQNAQSTALVYGNRSKDSKTIVIPYSSVDEVFVEINDPKDGSYLNTLAPTFSWTTGASNVTVRVYEVGTNHRSPQDALTGSNPCLVKDLSGVTTLTYPQDASRQLQDNKAYVLQVEAKASTNRGEMGNFSRPVVFRITDDKVGQMLDNFVKGLSGTASSTFTSLRSDPINWVAWAPYGNIALDGTILTENDVQTLLNELAGRTDVEFDVENQ